MRIIAAMDIIDGKCVRLTKGDFSTKKIYNENPLEIARQIEDHGINFLHFVDLDGAKNKKISNYKILEKITAATDINVDYGGGIRSTDDLKIAFDCGARQISCGSVSVTNQPLFLEWLGMWGKEKIILAADCFDHKIAIEGWTRSTGTDIIDFINDYVSKGIKYTICTDIKQDGMLKGPSTDLYKEILDVHEVSLIASGGISSLKEIKTLKAAGCEGAIIGKAIYEGVLTLKDLGRLC